MDTKAITIRAYVGTIDDIDALAKAMDRSRNYVVNQAMISYVAKSISGARPSAEPPTSMHPHPLIGVLPHPGLDDGLNGGGGQPDRRQTD